MGKIKERRGMPPNDTPPTLNSALQELQKALEALERLEEAAHENHAKESQSS